MQISKRKLKEIILEELQLITEQEVDELVSSLQEVDKEHLQMIHNHLQNPQALRSAIETVLTSVQ